MYADPCTGGEVDKARWQSEFQRNRQRQKFAAVVAIGGGRCHGEIQATQRERALTDQ
jgi:hypothetical protein